MFFRRLSTFSAIVLALFAPSITWAFSITPSLIDVQAKAGTLVEKTLILVNSSDREETYYLRAARFGVRNESGSPTFPNTDPDGVAMWIQFPQSSIVVPAHSRASAAVHVAVPPGTHPGEYYIAVLASTAPADIVAVIGGANVQANIAVLFFVMVDGVNLVKVGLLDVAMKDGHAMRDGLWGTYQFRLQNQGDVHVVPEGRVEIRDVFSRLIAEGKANEEKKRLLPNTTRTFEGELGQEKPSTFFSAAAAEFHAFALGPVHVRFVLKPGLVADQPIQTDLNLWVFPWQLGMCMIGGFILLYTLFRLLMRSRVS